jgi:hypothetical protein
MPFGGLANELCPNRIRQYQLGGVILPEQGQLHHGCRREHLLTVYRDAFTQQAIQFGVLSQVVGAGRFTSQ